MEFRISNPRACHCPDLFFCNGKTIISAYTSHISKENTSRTRSSSTHSMYIRLWIKPNAIGTERVEAGSFEDAFKVSRNTKAIWTSSHSLTTREGFFHLQGKSAHIFTSKRFCVTKFRGAKIVSIPNCMMTRTPLKYLRKMRSVEIAHLDKHTDETDYTIRCLGLRSRR